VALSYIYLILVFTAIVGVIQAAAAYSNLKGLCFFRSRSLSYIFSGIAVLVPMGYFFHWNYMWETNVVAGSQQAGIFMEALTAAVIFTLVISSLINFRLKAESAKPQAGLDAYKDRTFFQLVRERIDSIRH
jgi:hypothetical protein